MSSLLTQPDVPPRRVKPLGEITVGRRCYAAPILGQSGSSALPCWTLDVLNAVRRLGKTDMSRLGLEPLGKWRKGFANGKGREAD